MDSDSNTNLNAHQTRLQQTLYQDSHLDLTSNIVPGAEVQKGGGGFSDVFESVLDSNWQPRPDPNIVRLLQHQAQSGNVLHVTPESNTLQTTGFMLLSEPPRRTRVAVKRLRFWDQPISKLEKVISSPNIL